MLDKDGVATRIKNLRGDESRINFGKRYDITPGQVGHIETGRSSPEIRFLLALSLDCGVSVDYILKGENSVVKKIRDEEKEAMKKFFNQLNTNLYELKNYRQALSEPARA